MRDLNLTSSFAARDGAGALCCATAHYHSLLTNCPRFNRTNLEKTSPILMYVTVTMKYVTIVRIILPKCRDRFSYRKFDLVDNIRPTSRHRAAKAFGHVFPGFGVMDAEIRDPAHTKDPPQFKKPSCLRFIYVSEYGIPRNKIKVVIREWKRWQRII
jgi:hypothetical protein